MADILDQICAAKRDHINQQKAQFPLAEVEAAASLSGAPRGFLANLRRAAAADGIAVIAEIKRKSPSAGMIREDFSVAELALAYAEGGAACLSVLTDTAYFGGEDAFINTARLRTPLPVLRKDFTLDPYQVFEARAIGADAILLIMAAISDAQAAELADLAIALGMDVLVEVHETGELERALNLPCQMIGVNNRNLRTLQTSLATSEALAKLIPSDHFLVSESGIRTNADIQRLRQAGYSAFLVGEHLMQQRDVSAALQTLRGIEMK